MIGLSENSEGWENVLESICADSLFFEETREAKKIMIERYEECTNEDKEGWKKLRKAFHKKMSSTKMYKSINRLIEQSIFDSVIENEMTAQKKADFNLTDRYFPKDLENTLDVLTGSVFDFYNLN